MPLRANGASVLLTAHTRTPVSEDKREIARVDRGVMIDVANTQ